MTIIAVRPPHRPAVRTSDDAPAPVPTESEGGATTRRRAVLRTLAAGAVVAAALPFSLVSLGQDYQHGAALGELALIPLCALALALVAAHRSPWVLQLRAGRADYLAAAAAFGAALALFTWGPVAAGNHFQLLRPDLLALPLVAVAAVTLLFGFRALVAFVVPIGVLVLAWPLPLRAAMEPVADAVAQLTSGAVEGALHLVPLATVLPGPGDLRLTVEAPDGAFDVLVASACSGVAGIIGMLLVGLCAQYVLHGPRRARVAWLAFAVVGAWVLNLLRILLLLALGRTLGESVAMDVVHPVAGLVLLNTAMAVHVLSAKRFGLTFSLHRRTPSDTPLTAPVPAVQRMSRGQRARRAAALTSGVAVLAVLGTTVPVTAATYDGSLPAVVPFAEAPSVGPEFEAAAADEKTWARRYFGADSTWMRYQMAPVDASSGYTVWVDSVLTNEWSGLRAHPLIDCYDFHGFEIVSVTRPMLSAGLLADQVVYRNADGATWHVVSWEWPVRTAEGRMAHERVTLLASSGRTELDPGDSTTTDGGLRGALARRLAGEVVGEDPNPALSAALRGDANQIIDAHATAGAADSSGENAS